MPRKRNPQNTDTHKFCMRCRNLKPKSAFSKNRCRYDKLQTFCKKCMGKGYKPSKSQTREYWLTYKYGITKAEFDAMWENQGGMCGNPGCSSELFMDGVRGAQLDHNHETGKVRGILCKNCNLGLGNFRDDPERLRGAAQYLEEND